MKIYWSCAISLFFIFNTASAQTDKDTIYMDENWSICEKPVAEYYRVASVNTDKELLYVGDVTDYFIDGAIQMKGFYNEKGLRNGHFTFYQKNGNKTKEGDFEKDEMKGTWNYYDDRQNLITQFNCNSAVDFTPILIVRATGDTIIKHGDGHFIFNTQKDLPQIFPVAVNYTVEGDVVDGKKEGEHKYWLNSKAGKPKPFCTDIFKNGIFKRSIQDDHIVSKPSNLLNLMAENKLLKTDYFSHSNMVFGYGKSGDQKLLNYLLNGQVPDIKSEAHSFADNIKDVYKILGTVLRQSLVPDVHAFIHYSQPPADGSGSEILSYDIPTSTASPRNIKSDIILTIDTGGFVNNSIFKGNLNKSEITKINYYLSRLSNLVPFGQNEQLSNADIKISLITLFDTLKINTLDGVLNCTYLAVNTDKAFTAVNDKEDSPATFPGGDYAWKRYLERNLDRTAPLKDKTPWGNYTVKVQFMVDEQGNVSEVQAVEVPKRCPSCGVEAERVIRNGPKWKPATSNGKKVKYQGTQFVTFQILNESNFF